MRTYNHFCLQLNDGVKWHLDNPNIQVFMSFTIKITASHLRKIRYAPHQHELWNICNSMREEGATFLSIAKHLNENGYKSTRGKLFKNSHIRSILKNKLIADNRINKIYEPIIENLQIYFCKNLC